MRTQAYQEKRQAIFGKPVLGIDPGKQKHAGAVLDASGVQQGNTFRFEVSREGFDQTLWKQVHKRLGATGPEDIVVAIETSCNLWKTAAHYFYARGYTVVLVKPLVTHHSRPLMKQDFSRTDPKDAFLVADNARRDTTTPSRSSHPTRSRPTCCRSPMTSCGRTASRPSSACDP
jgi:transposase